MIAKLSELKTMTNNDAGTAEDARLTIALVWAQALMERHCGRLFESATTETMYHDGGGYGLYLNRWPLYDVTLALNVTIATDYNWAAATVLTPNVDYRGNAARGTVTRLPDGARWPAGPQIIRTIHRGGYTDPATTPLPSGCVYVAAHIQAAALLEATDLYKRRDEPGYKIVAAMPGGMASGYAPTIELLAIAKELLRGERR